jgi:hypothetical protein
LAVKGFVLCIWMAGDLGRTLFPTRKDASLAAFPDDVEFLGHCRVNSQLEGKAR